MVCLHDSENHSNFKQFFRISFDSLFFFFSFIPFQSISFYFTVCYNFLFCSFPVDGHTYTVDIVDSGYVVVQNGNETKLIGLKHAAYSKQHTQNIRC